MSEPASGRRHEGLVLSLRELARLGGEELLAKAKAGEIRAAHVWVAAEGAEKYRRAIAAGDVCGADAAVERSRRCDICPSMVKTDSALEIEGGIVIKCWCGPPFEDRTQKDKPTCGCLVALKINGVVHPAGKSVVASEKCDQRKWIG